MSEKKSTIKSKILGTLACAGVAGAIGAAATIVFGGFIHLMTQGAVPMEEVAQTALYTAGTFAAFTTGMRITDAIVNQDNEQ